jgi:pimeloyl-ACP methyl ester carboxylesterase
MRVVSPGPTFRKTWRLIRRLAQRMTSCQYSITSPKRKLILQGFLWEVLRRCTSAFVITIGHCPYALADVDMGQSWKRGRPSASEADIIANFIRSSGMQAFSERYAYGPTRVQFENKDPRGFAEFKQILSEHSAVGSANTQAGVQKERPSLYSLVEEMKKMTVPTLVISGDEDWPCLLPGILMKQSIPSAALSIIPNAGHAINIEEPDEYNRIVGEFLSQVDSGRWPLRDPRAISKSITGISLS